MAASGVVLSNVWEVKTVKSSHRLAAPAAGFFALSFAAAPLMAQGYGNQPLQRGGPPSGDTPYILITTFHSDDRKLGVEMADELRKRVSQEHSAKELFVIQKTPITNTLEASGYRPDSALSSSDLMELSKALRGELVVDGTITKAGERVKVESKILTKSGQATLTQPLRCAHPYAVRRHARRHPARRFRNIPPVLCVTSSTFLRCLHLARHRPFKGKDVSCARNRAARRVERQSCRAGGKAGSPRIRSRSGRCESPTNKMASESCRRKTSSRSAES